MGVIKCKVFKIEYKEDYDTSILVLADSIEEAMAIFKEKNPKYEIKGVHTYAPILRKTTKTITVEL